MSFSQESAGPYVITCERVEEKNICCYPIDWLLPYRLFNKKGVLKNFTLFTRKHLCSSLSLIKLLDFSTAFLLKRDSNTGVFL